MWCSTRRLSSPLQTKASVSLGRGGGLGRRDDGRDCDGAARSPAFVLDLVGGVRRGARLVTRGDRLVFFVFPGLVEGSLGFLRQAVFLVLFLPLTNTQTSQEIRSAGGHTNTHQHAFLDPGTHLLLHPVVFVDGVLVLGRRDPEEGGHPLPEVITGWGRRTDGQKLPTVPPSHHRKFNRSPSQRWTPTWRTLAFSRSFDQPEIVDVAALHMWNQKYGPQVSLDCNDKTSIHRSRGPKTTVHALPHRVNRGGQQVFLLRLLVLLFIGAVLLHGLPAGEVDDPPRNLLPLRLLRLVIPVHLPKLHTLEVFPRLRAPSLGKTSPAKHGRLF